MPSAIIFQSAEQTAPAKEYTGYGSSRGLVLVHEPRGITCSPLNSRERCNPPNRTISHYRTGA